MTDTSVNISVMDKDIDIINEDGMTIDQENYNKYDEHSKVLVKLVDKLLKNCNIHDEQSQIDKRLEKLLESVNKLNDIESKNSTLSQLKDLLIKVDEESLSKNGHCQSDNDKLIQEFFNYCVAKCIKEQKLESMIVVTVLLPELITKSHKNTLKSLIKQLSYVKIPPNWSKVKGNTFHSIRENLWSYKFPDHGSSLSRFDKLEQISLHHATLCYVPLPGLCTYPERPGVFNTLFPRHLSPFAKLILSNSSDILDISQSSSAIYESAPFQAITKFKWHAFARRRYFVALFIYFSHFTLYVAAISKTNKTTEGRWLMIASLILKVITLLVVSRYVAISVYNKFSIINIYPFLALILPVVTGFLFLYNDTSEAFSALQAISVFLLWIGFIVYLNVFKHIGILLAVIAHTCRNILQLLFLLTLILFAVAHSVLIYMNHSEDIVVNEEFKTGTFVAFYKAFINVWDLFLSDYSFLDQWKNNYLANMAKIAFSLFTSIIILNLLIAIVNNAYEEIRQRAYAEWTIARARAIVYIELVFMTPRERQNRNYFPLTITYEAFTEVVDKWPKKLKEDDILIPWEDIGEMIKMKEEIIKKTTDELEKLKQKLLIKGNLPN